jgi:dTDP-4-dehydrorhamnose 3,5-epimerase
MKVRPSTLAGAFLLQPDVFEDERGHFARTFSVPELAEHGLTFQVVQAAVSYNKKTGTLRGMHFQVPPHEQGKLVSCTRGAIYDVIVDVRSESPTRNRWEAFELSRGNRHVLLVPPGFAHGFITLEDESEVCYFISEIYDPACERGARWDDPAFGIAWPLKPAVLSVRDRSYPFWASKEETASRPGGNDSHDKG